MADDGKRVLDQAYAGLEAEVPDRVTRAIRWLRAPEARPVRLPVGVLLVLAGALGGWLPVLGVEMVPLGLLLVANDVPFLRKPVGRATLWLEARWRGLKGWWRGRR